MNDERVTLILLSISPVIVLGLPFVFLFVDFIIKWTFHAAERGDISIDDVGADACLIGVGLSAAELVRVSGEPVAAIMIRQLVFPFLLIGSLVTYFVCLILINHRTYVRFLISLLLGYLSSTFAAIVVLAIDLLLRTLTK
jgi:hypothetical protein